MRSELSRYNQDSVDTFTLLATAAAAAMPEDECALPVSAITFKTSATEAEVWCGGGGGGGSLSVLTRARCSQEGSLLKMLNVGMLDFTARSPFVALRCVCVCGCRWLCRVVWVRGCVGVEIGRAHV